MAQRRPAEIRFFTIKQIAEQLGVNERTVGAGSPPATSTHTSLAPRYGSARTISAPSLPCKAAAETMSADVQNCPFIVSGCGLSGKGVPAQPSQKYAYSLPDCPAVSR